MRVKPVKTIPIREQISLLDITGNRERYVIDVDSKIHYILDEIFGIIRRFETAYDRRGLSALHPREPCLAMIGREGALHVTDLEGVERWTKVGEFLAAGWTWDGRFLHTLLRAGPETLRLLVYDAAGRVRAQREFADPLCADAAFFVPIPGADEMALELRAGQNGCLPLFVRLEAAGIAMRPLHPHYAYTHLAFNGEGSSFLCIESGEGTFHRFTYPALEETGACALHLKGGGADQTPLHLGGSGIVRQGGRFYLLDTGTMQLGEELVIEGYEPPSDRMLCSDTAERGAACGISRLYGAGAHLLGRVDGQGGGLVVLRKADIRREDIMLG